MERNRIVYRHSPTAQKQKQSEKADKVADTKRSIEKKYVLCDICHKHHFRGQDCPRCGKNQAHHSWEGRIRIR